MEGKQFQNPLSHEVATTGDDQVIPMTLRELKEHEEQVNAQFTALKGERDGLAARVAALQEEVRSAVRKLRALSGESTSSWLEVSLVAGELERAL